MKYLIIGALCVGGAAVAEWPTETANSVDAVDERVIATCTQKLIQRPQYQVYSAIAAPLQNLSGRTITTNRLEGRRDRLTTVLFQYSAEPERKMALALFADAEPYATLHFRFEATGKDSTRVCLVMLPDADAVDSWSAKEQSEDSERVLSKLAMKIESGLPVTLAELGMPRELAAREREWRPELRDYGQGAPSPPSSSYQAPPSYSGHGVTAAQAAANAEKAAADAQAQVDRATAEAQNTVLQ